MHTPTSTPVRATASEAPTPNPTSDDPSPESIEALNRRFAQVRTNREYRVSERERERDCAAQGPDVRLTLSLTSV
jgi:hypothetical protein